MLGVLNPSGMQPNDQQNQYTFLANNQLGADAAIDINVVPNQNSHEQKIPLERKVSEELCWCCCERQPEEMKYLSFQKTCECAIQPACKQCQERLERCPICRRGIQNSGPSHMSSQLDAFHMVTVFVKVVLFIVIFAKQETKNYNYTDFFYVSTSFLSTIIFIISHASRNRDRLEYIFYAMLFGSIKGIAACIAFWSMIDMGGASKGLVIVDLINLIYKELLISVMVTGISIQLRQR